MEIFNGQLYLDSAASATPNVAIFGVATVGSGLPTGASSPTLLNGMSATAGSPYDYWFADANTLYVADDRVNTDGGLQKWTLSSGTWSLAYTKNIDTANDGFDNGLRGLQGSVDESGNVTLFATSTWGNGTVSNFLVGMTDTVSNTNAANVTVNQLVAAAANTNIRSMELIGINTDVTAGLAGDYNDDGAVDAADYVMWRKRYPDLAGPRFPTTIRGRGQ